MFKTLQTIDFLNKEEPVNLQKMFSTNRILRDEVTPSSTDAIALEGFFFESKEEKIKKFKEHWEYGRDHDLDGSEKMITDKNSLADKMDFDVKLFKEKLKDKSLNISNISSPGLSYTDMITGLEGTIALPEFVQKIFSVSPKELIKNDNILYTMIKSPPIAIKKAFVVGWNHQLTFRPEYHYTNGSKIHENEYLEKLGYNDKNILQVADHVELAIIAYHKLAAMLTDLKAHYQEYEDYAVAEIMRGASPKSYWNDLMLLTHLISPLWYEATAYSLRGFTEKALVVVKEVAVRY